MPTITVASFQFTLKDSIRMYEGGTTLLSTFVETCANAMNSSVMIVSHLLPIVSENTTTGSELPVAVDVRNPIRPMNTVTGRIATV